MTRQEITGKRDLRFSGWIREMLPPSNTGFLVTDIDFVLVNYKMKRISIVEIKTRGKSISEWQRKIYSNLHRWMRLGCEADGWKYCGTHLVQFENTFFNDGKCFFDGVETTESMLAERLSMFHDYGDD